MFYLYLVIFILTQYFFINSLNQLIFNGKVIGGDFIFSIVCIFFAFLIVVGALHTKHINNENLKKVGFGIIILGGIIVIFSLFTFNFQTIVQSIEFEIILSISGYLIYYYQTVPEGEPDVEIEENEEELENYSEPFSLNYNNFNENNITFIDEENIDHIVKPELEQIKNSINQILEIEELEQRLIENIKSINSSIEEIDKANSEYKLETISDIQSFFQILLNNIIQNNIEIDVIIQKEETFNLISKNLENIYYNTRGAQVYRSQKELHELVEKLLNLQIQS